MHHSWMFERKWLYVFVHSSGRILVRPSSTAFKASAAMSFIAQNHFQVAKFFSMTQLSSASLVTRLAENVPASEWQADPATPPADAAAADLFWEQH